MAMHEATSTPRLSLGPDDDGRPLTAGEFAEADYKEPYRYERVRGRLVVMSPEGGRHADGVDPWRDQLVFYKMTIGRAYVQRVRSEAWMRVDDSTDRIADLGVYLAREGTAPPIPDRVPDLVFEVVSPDRASRRRDYVEKRSDYFRLGVGEYVIIDPRRRRVTAYARTQGGYRKRVVRPPDAYTTDLLPGLAIPLVEVFGP